MEPAQNNKFNSYDNRLRAESYAGLEFSNTYYLAFRDIPGLIRKYVKGKTALDFGCGTGRSTRFLENLGFECVGIDISGQMIKQAVKIDPSGNYLLVEDGDFSPLNNNKYDLIFSAFTFDNIPGKEKRISVFISLAELLGPDGIMICLDSTPDIYLNEWASFSTKDFPENRNAGSGDEVKIIMKDVSDKRPVIDIIWFNEDYLDCFKKAGLQLLENHRPLGCYTEHYKWISETKIAPWVIYVTGKSASNL